MESVAPDKDIESTLQYFQREGATLCLVRSQASPVGIITLEDILEQVVGRIEDEYPRNRKLSLQEFLVADATLLDLKGSGAQEIFTEMIQRIPPSQRPEDVDLVELAMNREREQPTSVSGGIAIPHVRCHQISQPLVVFGRSKQGAPFDSSTSELVHFIFLLITPSEPSEIPVILLNQIGNVVNNEAIRHRLLEASTPAEVSDLLMLANMDVSGS